MSVDLSKPATDPTSNAERLKRLSWHLRDKKSLMFNFIQDEGEPYLFMVTEFEDYSFGALRNELHIEINDGHFDLWLRQVKPGEPKACQRGWSVEILREVAVAKYMLDGEIVTAAVKSFLKNWGGDHDLLFKHEPEPEPEKVPTPREWGITNIFERDENDEYFVSIPEEEHELMPVGTGGRHIAGVDFYHDRVDFGMWNHDGEWIVKFSVQADGRQNYTLG